MTIENVRPQSRYICGADGSVIVDFVGRFETYAKDIRQVLSKIGVVGNVPHLNGTLRKHYATYYTPEAVEIIERIYRQDIERFGYRFEAQGAGDASEDLSVEAR